MEDKDTKKTKTVTQKNLWEKLLIVQKNMEAVVKDSNNPYFKSKYADLNAIMGVAKPVLNENGLFVSHIGKFVEGQYCISTIIYDDKGESVECTVPILLKAANDPQAQGSSISYARRYGLSALLAIETEDDDGNAGAANGTKVSQPAQNVKAQTSAQPKVGVQTRVSYPDEEENYESLFNEEYGMQKKCPSCGKDMVLRKSAHGQFWGCSGYPTCKHTE